MKNFNTRLAATFITAGLITVILTAFPIGLLTAPLPSGEFRIIALNSAQGVIVSEDGGVTWKDMNMGLPRDIIPERIASDALDNLYLSTRRSGIYRFDKKENRWQDLNSNYFLLPRFGDRPASFRRISAFALNPKMPGVITLATKHSLFVKKGRDTWERLSGESPAGYLTALAFGPSGEIYAGTSYDGIYTVRNGRFARISSGLPGERHSKTLYFYEEISNIANDDKTIYAGLNFGGGIYASDDRGGSWRDLKFPMTGVFTCDIHDMKPDKNYLYVSSGNGIFRLDVRSGAWQTLDFKIIINKISREPENLSFLMIEKSKKYPAVFFRIRDYKIKKGRDFSAVSSGRKAIYAGLPSTGKKLDGYLSFIKKNELNAVVIDMKDDSGYLRFPSNNSTAVNIGAVKSRVNLAELLNTVKRHGIYSIARIVVFKDEKLFGADNNKYAIWDRAGDCPWKGKEAEFWVDPYSDFVRKYNIDIAVELEEAGFDEIQFDYIRFPSDGPVNRCLFRNRTFDSVYKSEVLSCFLREAKERLGIPVSADVYGYNSWHRFENPIGQDIEEFAEIIDVLCPMNYPSHFGRLLYDSLPEDEKTFRIIYNSGRRAGKLSGGNAIIRPYLQAFNLLSPSWGPGYIESQTRGARESGCSGYTFWNARCDYKMVEKALSPPRPGAK